VSAAAVETALAGGAPLPPHATLVSFQLGHRSVVDSALPVLSALGIPAVAFVVSGLVDTESPYWWQEAEYLIEQGGWARGLSLRAPGGVRAALSALPDPDRRRSLQELRVTARRQAPRCAQLTSTDLLELLAGGFALGNHTLGHTRLENCDDYALRDEVVGGHERLARLTGEQPTAFAYPDGGFDPRAESLLRGLGYRSAFLSDGALFDLRGPRGGEQPDALRISRLNVNAGTARGIFDGVLSGWAPTTRKLRGEVAV
jgi:peptidoglycan/xylan/chitin deacetylase (PgdA/CDA1 family)